MAVVLEPGRACVPERAGRTQRYLMCPPAHFGVQYRINPWMWPGRPVNQGRARMQWERLRRAYERLGHCVETIAARPGLPDMVFAANAGLVIDGRVLAARFRHDERRGEELPYREWFARHGYEVHVAEHVNEGEGDFLVAGDVILAGAGFRTVPEAHAEVAEYFERPVVSLDLVDPRYYHLDTALCVLDERTIAYYPHAFSDASTGVLRELFPDAIQASAADAAVLGLNATSDGRHVVLPAGAPGLSAQLAERGYEPVPVDMSELRKAGGAAKCCTLELRTLDGARIEGVAAR